MHEGTLHFHWSSGVVRRDPTKALSSTGFSEMPSGFDSTLGYSDDSVSVGSSLGGAGCCVASESDSGPWVVSVGGHRMQPASCSNSWENLSSNVPESNICVTAMMTRLFSDIQFRPSSAIWDGASEGFCPPPSMLPRPNHAAVVSLLLPTPGHLNSDLAAWNAPGLASPSSLVETGDQSVLKRLFPAFEAPLLSPPSGML